MLSSAHALVHPLSCNDNHIARTCFIATNYNLLYMYYKHYTLQCCTQYCRRRRIYIGLDYYHRLVALYSWCLRYLILVVVTSLCNHNLADTIDPIEYRVLRRARTNRFITSHLGASVSVIHLLVLHTAPVTLALTLMWV